MLRTVLLLCLIYSAFVPSPAAAQQEIGLASFYAAISDRSQKFSAAHRTLPFGSMVRVTRVDTGAHVDVRINDRGPFIRGRVIDVSRAAAEQIGMIGGCCAGAHSGHSIAAGEAGARPRGGHSVLLLLPAPDVGIDPPTAVI